MALLSVLMTVSALAATKPRPGQAQLLLDMGSGKVLQEQNADQPLHPASLTKMMTLYLTFEALKSGELDWTSRVPISAEGFATPAFKFALPEGATFTVREAVEGMIVISANDAAQSMCDYLAGRKGTSCGGLMTAKARTLGMSRSTFTNGSGLHDPRQVTTARDMATLGRALIRDFPDTYPMFSQRYFTFRGTKLRGHNSLMYGYEGMDGLKTGFTEPSGYNLVSSAKRGNRRLIGVVLGGTSGGDRAEKMRRMMDTAFGTAAGSEALATLAPSVSRKTTPEAPATAALSATRSAPAGALALREDPAAASATALPFALLAPKQKPARPAASSVPVAPTAGAQAQAVDIPGSRNASANRSAWEVQIAAVERQDAALTLLDDARKTLGGQFGGLAPVTETVGKGANRLIRARLTGFSSKTEAMKACRLLQARDKSCFVVGNKA
ncbi:serine hydrolase [Roseibium aestuarii]|uniref:Serine hydrolase n=2 Tax=Roseibium aestuarii TaxID=2600299 RepID=A0ABW4JVS4_9HYPH